MICCDDFMPEPEQNGCIDALFRCNGEACLPRIVWFGKGEMPCHELYRPMTAAQRWPMLISGPTGAIQSITITRRLEETAPILPPSAFTPGRES